MIPHKQLSLANIYSDCKTFFESDKPKFLSLFENIINLDEFKASITIFDTSGIETFVTKNNSKYANKVIKHLSLYALKWSELNVMMANIEGDTFAIIKSFPHAL